LVEFCNAVVAGGHYFARRLDCWAWAALDSLTIF
jgi:hypothetical protein